MAKRKKTTLAKRYRVFAVTSGRGGYTGMWPVTFSEARRLAAAERSRGVHDNVRIDIETDPVLIKICNS